MQDGASTPPGANLDNDAVKSIDNELNKEMESPDYNEEKSKTLILALASASFGALSSGDYETLQMLDVLNSCKSGDTDDPDLLHSIVKEIYVQPSGKVIIQLKNEQPIEGR